MTYQDKMTLGEIAYYDREMFADVIRGARRHTFTNKVAATRFAAASVLRAIEHCGVKDPHKLSDKDLDAAQARCGIRAEHRDFYRMHEDWKNGFYIYKNDELVGFVSDVNGGRRLVYKSLSSFATEEPDKFWVVTNVKVA